MKILFTQSTLLFLRFQPFGKVPSFARGGGRAVGSFACRLPSEPLATHCEETNMKVRAPSTSLDARWHLGAEINRLLQLLAAFLTQQRQRGRSPRADLLKGYVIEEGEAEGLLGQLTAAWQLPAATPTKTAPSPSPRQEVAALAEAASRQGVYLPLRHAAQAFSLTTADYDTLLLALAAELDARFGRLFAYLNDHVGQTLPTLGLALALATLEAPGEPVAPFSSIARPLFRDGLLELAGDGPLPGRSLCLSPEMGQRLTHTAQLPPQSWTLSFFPVEMGLINRLILTAPIRQALTVWAAESRAGSPDPPPLILAGTPGSGRTAMARAAAAAAGLPLVAVHLDRGELPELLRLARREARWFKAALLLRTDNPDQNWQPFWEELRQTAYPLLLAVPLAAPAAAAALAPRPANLVCLPEPDLDQRRRLWQALLPPTVDLADDAAELLAAGFHFNPGRITATINRAQADLLLQLPGRRRLTIAGLFQAARSLGAEIMGPLAQKLPCPYEPDELVVPPQVRAELNLALAWIRQQHKVLTEWGFAQRLPLGGGLKALFAGPAGTGKTMAAQVLARQLQLDLYRVDLSRVVSKYIGETEKNLGQLFDEAHRSGAMLFFDEADALFGKRSEVKDAHDRYANIEVGYLLQRLEEHDGVVILATNRRQDLDDAFVRRFDMILEFPLPNAAERRRIWEGMFPTAAQRDPSLNLDLLAQKFELSGGEIKNAVLAAAYLAAEAGQPIGLPHLRQAIRRELIKSGRVVDAEALQDLGS